MSIATRSKKSDPLNVFVWTHGIASYYIIMHSKEVVDQH